MFTQTFQIAPYRPVLAEEQAGKANDQVAIVDGMNFLSTVKGVQSAFGVVEQSGSVLATGRHPGCFTVANERVFCFADGLYKLVGGVYVRQIEQAPSQLHATYDLDGYPWSYAYVGTRHWFCHPRYPQLFYYDEFDQVWGLYRDACWNGPVFSITQADNSLIVLLQDVVMWSKFDQGHLFALEAYGDSGCQSLARMRYGQPFAVMPYNGAWLTFTSMGIMLSRPVLEQSQHPDQNRLLIGTPRFNHADISHDLAAYGPTAICHADARAVIWLAAQGFYAFTSSQGGGFGAIVDYAPEMGAFYSETLVPHATSLNSLLDEFMLTYLPETRWLVVSSRTEGIAYSRAHVYQPKIERWGSFNHEHLALVPNAADTEIEEQRRTRRHVAAIGVDGRLQVYDAQSSAAASWVRLSPIRLQVQEELTPYAVISVQGVRIGCHEPVWSAAGRKPMQSSWRVDQAEETHPSEFRAVLYGGDGPIEYNGDEVQYLTPFRRVSNVASYTCHITGVDLSLMILALEATEHFAIHSVEMDYFYAGVL